MDLVIVNGANSFTIQKDSGDVVRYERNRLFTKQKPDTNKLLIFDRKTEGGVILALDVTTDTIDVDGTTSWASATVLDTALEPLFFLANSSGGGTPATSVDVTTINQGDWIVGGTSGYYYDITHALGSKNLLYDVYDITGGSYDGYSLNEYLPQSTTVYRVESTVNTVDVVVVLSNGGDAVVTDSLAYGTEETGDFAPVAKGGFIIPVNSATDVTVTINTNSCAVGETVYYEQMGAGRILLTDGSLASIPYVYGSYISGGVGSLIGSINMDGSRYKSVGDLQ